jgi:hypothetical protein
MNDRTRKALRTSTKFGGFFAAWSLVKSLSSVTAGTAPLLVLVAAPAFSFVLFGGAAFLLLMIGAATTSSKSPGDPNISPWFAWMVAGAFVAFWVGTFVMTNRDNALSWGALTAGLWAAGVLIAWAIVRFRRRSGSTQGAAIES